MKFITHLNVPTIKYKARIFLHHYCCLVSSKPSKSEWKTNAKRKEIKVTLESRRDLSSMQYAVPVRFSTSPAAASRIDGNNITKLRSPFTQRAVITSSRLENCSLGHNTPCEYGYFAYVRLTMPSWSRAQLKNNAGLISHKSSTERSGYKP